MNANRRTVLAAAVAAVLLGTAGGPAIAQQTIYGSQLMTRKERLEYRERLRAAKTQEERNRIRAEHHERMQERARERGVKLPDMPPAGGAGAGPGPGGGGGMGGGGGGRP